MRITICEFPDEVERKDAAWSGIVSVLEGPGTELVVLPEMPFCAWQMFTTRRIDSEAWRAALAAHDEMIARFGELNADAVLASRPIERDGTRFNEAFYWTRHEGYVAVRTKYYLPDEPDGWEAWKKRQTELEQWFDTKGFGGGRGDLVVQHPELTPEARRRFQDVVSRYPKTASAALASRWRGSGEG